MKKFKFFSIILIFISLFFTSCAKQDPGSEGPPPQWEGGIEKPDGVIENEDGTITVPDTIEITKAEHLAYVAHLVNGTLKKEGTEENYPANDLTGKTVNLMNDIGLRGYNFPMIGIYKGNKPFRGTFDGKGYQIQNLEVNHPKAIGVGLFAYISHDARIEDVLLMNPNVTGLGFVGGIVGRSVGNNTQTPLIIRCEVRGGSVTGAVGGVTANEAPTGGIAGSLIKTDIAFVKNAGTRVTGNYWASGVVNCLHEGQLAFAFNNGSVVAELKAENGGIAGGVTAHTLEDDKARTSYSDLFTENDLQVAMVYNVFNQGSVHGAGEASGGVLGQHMLGTILGAFSIGEVKKGVKELNLGQILGQAIKHKNDSPIPDIGTNYMNTDMKDVEAYGYINHGVGIISEDKANELLEKFPGADNIAVTLNKKPGTEEAVQNSLVDGLKGPEVWVQMGTSVDFAEYYKPGQGSNQ